ncbi:MAG TPA: O-antigen ligase family protein [Caulobacteraceae bacterium]|nr:O-antigen ligase family protein [Caulobacteraceae bacterium]
MLLDVGRLAPDPPSEQRFILAICSVLAVAAPLCLYFGVRGFAPVVGIGGVLCLPWARPARHDWPGILILAALVAWACVGIAWTPAPNLHPRSLKDVSRLTILHLGLELVLCVAFVTALARLGPAPARKALTWLAYGLLAIELAVLVDGLFHAAFYQWLITLTHGRTRPDLAIRALAQGGYAAAVMVWPLGMALRRQGQPRLAWALAAFMPLSLIIMRGFAPTAALAASVIGFYLAYRFGRRAVIAFAVLTAAYMLLTPLVMIAIDHGGVYALAKDHVPPSWAERLRIWSFVAERFQEHPVRGAGLDASRVYPGVVPLHPHNGPLQLWFELGLPGALFGTVFWLWLWRRIGDCADRNRLYGAVASATAMVYLMISAVGFGLWQEWWICLGALAMALSILFSKTLAASVS